MRALYGTNIAYNAVHGSENSQVVEHEINLLFSQDELNPKPLIVEVSEESKPINELAVGKTDISNRLGSRNNLASRMGSKTDMSGRLGSRGDLSGKLGSRNELSSTRLGGSKLGSKVDITNKSPSKKGESAVGSKSSLSKSKNPSVRASISNVDKAGSKIELSKVASRIGSKLSLAPKSSSNPNISGSKQSLVAKSEARTSTPNLEDKSSVGVPKIESSSKLSSKAASSASISK